MRRYLLTLLLLLVFLAYAVARYVLFGTVPPAHIPLYVLNKAVSLLALVLVGTSLVIGPLARLDPDGLPGWLGARRWVGLAGLGLALVHVLLTLPIFGPAYYGKFFAQPDGATGLTLAGELSLLAGILATAGLVWQGALSRRPTDPAPHAPALHTLTVLRRLGWLVVALVAIHCVFMGWSGWWTPATWPGGLPPISLLAVLFALAVTVVRLVLRHRGRG